MKNIYKFVIVCFVFALIIPLTLSGIFSSAEVANAATDVPGRTEICKRTGEYFENTFTKNLNLDLRISAENIYVLKEGGADIKVDIEYDEGTTNPLLRLKKAAASGNFNATFDWGDGDIEVFESGIPSFYFADDCGYVDWMPMNDLLWMNTTKSGITLEGDYRAELVNMISYYLSMMEDNAVADTGNEEGEGDSENEGDSQDVYVDFYSKIIDIVFSAINDELTFEQIYAKVADFLEFDTETGTKIFNYTEQALTALGLLKTDKLTDIVGSTLFDISDFDNKITYSINTATLIKVASVANNIYKDLYYEDDDPDWSDLLSVDLIGSLAGLKMKITCGYSNNLITDATFELLVPKELLKAVNDMFGEEIIPDVSRDASGSISVTITQSPEVSIPDWCRKDGIVEDDVDTYEEVKNLANSYYSDLDTLTVYDYRVSNDEITLNEDQKNAIKGFRRAIINKGTAFTRGKTSGEDSYFGVVYLDKAAVKNAFGNNDLGDEIIMLYTISEKRISLALLSNGLEVQSLYISREVEKEHTEEFEFSYSFGEYTLTGYYGAGGEVTIPSTYKGKPVTAIDSYVFEEASGYWTDIYIPKSIKNIEYNAFSYRNMQSSSDEQRTITFESGTVLYNVGSRALGSNYSVTTVKGNPTISGRCRGLEYCIVEELTLSGKNAVISFDYSSIAKLNVKKDVTGRFLDSSNYYGNIGQIVLESGNPAYVKVGAGLYSTDKTCLYYVDELDANGDAVTEFTIPKTVVTIEEGALSNHTFEKIDYESGSVLKTIKRQKHLQVGELHIPATVTSSGLYDDDASSSLASKSLLLYVNWTAVPEDVSDGLFSRSEYIIVPTANLSAYAAYNVGRSKVLANDNTLIVKDGLLISDGVLIKQFNYNYVTNLPDAVESIGEYALNSSMYKVFILSENSALLKEFKESIRMEDNSQDGQTATYAYDTLVKGSDGIYESADGKDMYVCLQNNYAVVARDYSYSTLAFFLRAVLMSHYNLIYEMADENGRVAVTDEVLAIFSELFEITDESAPEQIANAEAFMALIMSYEVPGVDDDVFYEYGKCIFVIPDSSYQFIGGGGVIDGDSVIGLFLSNTMFEKGSLCDGQYAIVFADDDTLLLDFESDEESLTLFALKDYDKLEITSQQTSRVILPKSNYKAITVASGNPNYVYEDGILYYTADGTEFVTIAVCTEDMPETVNIKAGVSRIYFQGGDNYFKDKKLVIPASVVEIDYYLVDEAASITLASGNAVYSTGEFGIYEDGALFWVTRKVYDKVTVVGISDIVEKFAGRTVKELVITPTSGSSYYGIHVHNIDQLEKITIEEGWRGSIQLYSSSSVKEIRIKGQEVFAYINCSSSFNDVKVIFDADVEGIDFSDFSGLEISFDGTPENYFVDEYAIYNKDKSVLYCVNKLTNNSFEIANTVGEISEYAFNSVSQKLKMLTFQRGSVLKEIADYTFANCYYLGVVTLPSSITNIYDSSFNDNTKIIVEEGNVNYVYINDDYLVEVATQTLIGYRGDSKDVVVPKSVKDINRTVFYGVNSVSFEDGSQLQSIGAYFIKNGMLKSLTLPDGIVYIDDYALWGCYNIDWVYIPASVEYIGWDIVQSDCIIYGVPDSYAEEWAKDYRFTFESPAIIGVEFNYEGDETNTYLGYKIILADDTDETQKTVVIKADVVNLGMANLAHDYTLMIVNSRGAVVFKKEIKGSTITTDNIVIECPDMLTVSASVTNAEVAATDYDIVWYRNGELIYTGKTLSGISDTDDLTVGVKLKEAAGVKYLTPAVKEVGNNVKVSFTLTARPTATFSGTVKNSDGANVAGALVAIVQKVENGLYTLQDAVYTDASGVFSFTVVEGTIEYVVSHAEYVVKTGTSTFATAGATAGVSLDRINGNFITVTAKAVRAQNVGANEDTYDITLNNISFSLYNATKQAAVRFDYNNGKLLFVDEVAAADVIEITATDLSGKLAVLKTSCTLDAAKTAAVALKFTEKGSLLVTFDTSEADANVLFVFDETGKLSAKFDFRGNMVNTGNLKSGRYTLVAMQKLGSISSVDRIQKLSALGLVQDEDYETEVVEIINGITDVCVFEDINAIDENRFNFVTSSKAYLDQASYVIGVSVKARIEYLINDIYADDASNQRIEITLPVSALFTEGSLTIDGVVTDDYSIVGNSLIINVDANSAKVAFAFTMTSPQDVNANAYLAFTNDDGNVMQNLGNLYAEISDLSMKIPEKTGRNSVLARGEAYPGSIVRIYDNNKLTTTVNPSATGKWEAILNIEGTGVHNIYAMVITEDNTTLKTAVYELDYNTSYASANSVNMKYQGISFELKYDEIRTRIPYYTYYPNIHNFYFDAVFSTNTVKNVVINVMCMGGDVFSFDAAQKASPADTVFYAVATMTDIPVALSVSYQDADGVQYNEIYQSIKPIIDPSGFVYDTVTSNTIEGVTATIWYKESVEDDDSTAVQWDGSMFGFDNPIITGTDGKYAWDVPEGMWKVKFQKDGYEDAETAWLPVPPEQKDINICMKPTAAIEVAKTEALYINSEYLVYVYFNQYFVVDDNVGTLTLEGIASPTYDFIATVTENGIEYSNGVVITLSDISGLNTKAIGGIVGISETMLNDSIDFSVITTLSEVDAISFSTDDTCSISDTVATFSVDNIYAKDDADNNVNALITVKSSDIGVLYFKDGNVISDTKTVSLTTAGLASLAMNVGYAGNVKLTFTVAHSNATAEINVSVTAAAVLKELATPVASMANGMAISGGKVRLMSADSGVTIYYTTDGSVPTAASQVYSGGITITSAMTIKYVAVKGVNTSEVGTLVITDLGYQVSFYADGVLIDSRIVDGALNIDSLPAVPEKVGYVGKWQINGSDITGSAAINANTVVNVAYAIKQIKITFKVEGQDDIVKTVDYGSELIDIPAVPVKVGYNGNWSQNDFENMTEDAVVTAIYTLSSTPVVNPGEEGSTGGGSGSGSGSGNNINVTMIILIVVGVVVVLIAAITTGVIVVNRKSKKQDEE